MLYKFQPWFQTLNQHMTSHCPGLLWVATACVRSKCYGLVLLPMTVSISMTCVSGFGKASTLPHGIIEKNVLSQWSGHIYSFPATISIITCTYHMHALSYGLEILFVFGDVVPEFWEVCSPTTTKMLATIIQWISQLFVEIPLWPFSTHLFFSSGSSWCTCSATSLSLQHCQRCCARGRMWWTIPRAGAEMTWWRGKRTIGQINRRLFW